MKRFYCGLLAAALAAGMAITPASALDFQDIQSHWGKSAIQQVTDWGLFSGTGEGTFSPDGVMTRGMFVAVLAKTAQHLDVYKAPAGQADFADVDQGAYYASAVAWAKENGLVSGKTQDTFAPNDQITREQMCLIMTQFLTKFTDHDLTPYQGGGNAFLDKVSIHDYAEQSVELSVALGLIAGIPVSGGVEFQPAQPASRAAVAVVLQNLVSVAHELPAIPEAPKGDQPGGAGGASGGGASGGGGGGGGGSNVPVTPPEQERTEEEIAEEATVAGYLDGMLTKYRNSTYILTTDKPVREAMDLLMGCIEDALDQRGNGVFLDRSFIREEYATQIDQLKDDYRALTEDQRNQLNNVIVRLGDTDVIYTVMDYFGVEMS